MSALAPVSVAEIRDALSACDGKVAPAARLLGLARNVVYKRLARSGINPDEFRRGPAALAPHPPRAARPTHRPLRVSRTFYLRPDQTKLIDEACLDLPPVLREKLSPSKVLEKLIEDCFDGWLAAKLGR